MKFRDFIPTLAVLLSVTWLPLGAQEVSDDDRLLDAVSLIDNGQTDPAFAILDSLSKGNPGNDAIHYHLSRIYLSEGDGDNAIRQMREALALSPGNDHYKSTLALLLGDKGDLNAAAALYMELIRDYPSRYGDEFSWTMIGDSHYLCRRDSLALDAYSKALVYNPSYTPALLARAEIFKAQRNYPAYFSIILPYCADPEEFPYLKVSYIRGYLKTLESSVFKLWNPQVDQMIELCAQAHPTDSSALRLALEWYAGTGRSNIAAGYISRMLEYYPGDIEAHMVLAQMLLERNDYESTIAVCREVLSIEGIGHDDYMVALSLIGDCLHNLGQEKECIRVFEYALSIDPDYAPVLNNYAYYLSIKGKKLAKAEKMSRRALLSDPDNCTFLDTLGWILYLKKDYQEAQACFKRAMSHGGSDNTVILLHYSALLYAMGDTVKADNYKWKAEHKR